MFKLFQSGAYADAKIKADMAPLDRVERGLAAKALAYITTGKPETVLSSITTLCQGDVLRLGEMPQRWKKSKISHRPQYFLDGDDGDLVRRYGEVLAASDMQLPGWVLGAQKTSAPFRLIVSTASMAAIDNPERWPHKARTAPVKALTPDRIAALAETFGEDRSAVFEVLYWGAQRYSSVEASFYLELVDMRAFTLAHPEAAVAGLNRLHAQGKVNLLKAFLDWGLCNTAPFFDAVMASLSDGSKAVREAALGALHDVDAATLVPAAMAGLDDTKSAVRLAMVSLLGRLETDTARAALQDHAKVEKTAKVKAAISTALALSDVMGDGRTDTEQSYLAIDGTQVEIPPFAPLHKDAPVKVDAAERRDLEAAEAREKEKISNQPKHYYRKFIPGKVKRAVGILELVPANDGDHSVLHFLGFEATKTFTSFLSRAPTYQKLVICFGMLRQVGFWLQIAYPTSLGAAIRSYLASPEADLRAVEQIWIERGLEVTFGGFPKTPTRAAKPGDVLRNILDAGNYWTYQPGTVPDQALWPYLATQFEVLDAAFGVGKPDIELALDRLTAIRLLSQMPKPPMRYFGSLLEAATGERKQGRAEARKMLADAPDLNARLVELLSDTRQAIRAGAAEWMGERGDEAAIKPLKARLKKEKSELAKASILTALGRLGAQLDDFVGPAALLKEAEAGMAKIKGDKLDWLALAQMPKLTYQSGKPVPQIVPQWWLNLAVKLKQPGGNALFEIYLDQLKPATALAFSRWLLDAWIRYDTDRPSDAEANAYAEAHADQQVQSVKRWLPDYTREQALAELRRVVKSDYYNSGTATNGLLGLTTRMDPPDIAAHVQAYLKTHGSRTSQARALLQVLAAKGDPISLQVVIAAATRLKQKSVQAFAGELVNAIAEAKNWTMNELADRVVPSAGFDDAGHLDLPIGPDAKPYSAILSDDLTVIVKNPEGAVIKALPGGEDDTTKTSKKQLSTSRKELKQVVKMQSARLYEALCTERAWQVADWERDFRGHPVMRRLIERAVWQGLDRAGKAVFSFRPTAEGELIDAEDNPIGLETLAGLHLAHGATMDAATAKAWAQHLADYEVTPLFAQFGRSLKTLPEGAEEHLEIVDRKGWVLENFKLRGVATKLGWERGPAEDGGWFICYRKSFAGAGITASVEFTGSPMPEENHTVGLISLAFVKDQSHFAQPIALKEVPKVLLSECWNDFHAMAEKGVYDPNWEKTCAW